MEEDFNVFFQANERRIYYQIQRLRIPRDLYEEFYAEGILALWHAYKHYKPEKGRIGTFINYIRKSSNQRSMKTLFKLTMAIVIVKRAYLL